MGERPSRTHALAAGLGLAAFFVLGYFGIPNLLLRAGVGGVDLATPVDRALPYVPAAAYAYALCYLQILLPPLVARDARLFLTATGAVAVVLGVSFATFALLPARVAYPPIGSASGEWILRKNALFSDHGFNAFPSLHVALATWSALSIHDTCPRWRVPIWLTTAAIAVSTVLVKRHFVVDVPAGALLAWLVYRRMLAGPARAWRAARLAGRDG